MKRQRDKPQGTIRGGGKIDKQWMKYTVCEKRGREGRKRGGEGGWGEKKTSFVHEYNSVVIGLSGFDSVM
jgi:hypothetical protein